MSSPASVARHPIHPMLVVFPIGFWTFSLVCDIIYVFGGREPMWNQVALYTAIAGIIGAALAAVPGIIDYLSIDEKDMRAIGTRHLIVNSAALVVFILACIARLRGMVPAVPFALSVIGIVLISIGGWFGGELVYVKGMAVEPADEQDSNERRRSSRRDSRLGRAV